MSLTVDVFFLICVFTALCLFAKRDTHDFFFFFLANLKTTLTPALSLLPEFIFSHSCPSARVAVAPLLPFQGGLKRCDAVEGVHALTPGGVSPLTASPLRAAPALKKQRTL